MGICGDEDGGAMSAWTIFSAMGFYPIAPGLPVYIIGTPLFDEMKIQLSGGRTLVIKGEGNSAQHKYIQSATLNGKKLENAWLEHDDIMNGGELVFEMGPRPNKAWGAIEPPPCFP